MIDRALLTAAVLLLGSSTSGGAAEADRKAQVLEAVARLGAAFRAADVETLAPMLGPDYIHTNTGGGVVGREQWLSYVASRRKELDSGALVLSAYENRDLEVRFHGATAIVTGLNVSEGTRNAEPFARHLRFTQVWFLADGAWRRVAFHDTEMTR